MIVGEYDERAVYKCYNVVGNQFIVVISKYNSVFYGHDEPYFARAHSASAGGRHCNQAYNTYLVQGHRDDVGGSFRGRPSITLRCG